MVPDFLMAIFNTGNISYIYGEPVFHSNHGVCYLLYILILTRGADKKFLSTFNEMSSRNIPVLLPDGINKIINGEVMRLKLIAVCINQNLPFQSS